jgi:tetratricopeptide (TPR) repeat protein
MTIKGKRLIPLLLIPVLLLLLHSCTQNGQGESGNKDLLQEELTEIERLNKAIDDDPSNAGLINKRAQYYLRNGNVNEALSDINSALQVDSKNAEHYITLSDIYLSMGKLNNCIEALEKAEELDPENTSGLLKQAEVYLILREYQKTFEYVKRALVIDDFNPIAYFIRGYALLETGDTVKAVREFIRATEQDQQYYEAYMQLGLLYAAKNDPLSIGYYRNAINARPDNPEPYYFLGMFFQDNEDIENAIRIYDQLLTVDPDYSDAYYNLGYINLVYTGDYEMAVKHFTDVIIREPAHTDAYYNRGYAHELSGDYNRARNDYKKALEITPNYPLAVEGMNRIEGK